MSNLRTLHDAFHALEERADARSTSLPEFSLPTRPAGRGVARFVAPGAAAAVVVAAATGVAVWQHGGSSGPSGPAGSGGTRAGASPTASPSTTAPPVAPTRFQPPETVAALAARARAILAGTATITVDPALSSGAGAVSAEVPTATHGVSVRSAGRDVVRNAPVTPTRSPSRPTGSGDGAALVGTLTAAGRTGGFDLDVYRASTGSTAMCDADTHCSVQRRADGSTLAVGSWHDSAAAGGVTYLVELVRPDGADIRLHLSTEHDPKGGSAVTASRLPLTVAQMTAFVTSDRW